MKTITNYLPILLILLLVSTSSYAQVNTTIFYGNGILSDRDSAQESLRVLKKQLKNRFSATEFSQVEFELAYNKTQGVASDLLEAALQLGVVSASGYYRLLSKIDIFPDSLQQGFLNVAIKFDETALKFEDVKSHVESYKSHIASKKRIIIVPHSQGNYFSSLSYNHLTPDEQKYFGVVSVANVGKIPADGRLIYTSSAADVVVDALFLNKVFALPPNVANPFNVDDKTGHYFVESYLKVGYPTQTKIIDDVWATFYSLPSFPLIVPVEAKDDQANVQSDSIAQIDVYGNDIYGNNLSLVAFTQGSNGFVESTQTGLSYTPNLGFVGTDAFTYTITDDSGTTSTATVAIDVLPDPYNLSPESQQVSESAGVVTFTLTRTDDTTDETVYVSTLQNQGAVNNGDYEDRLNEPVFFSVGITEQTISIAITLDSKVEADETFGLLIEDIPSGLSLATATFTIKDAGPVTSINEGILAHFKLDGDGVDATGNGFDASIVTGSAAADRFGNADSAFYFDGQDDVILTGLNMEQHFSPADPITFSLWFKNTNLNNNGSVLSGSLSGAGPDFAAATAPDGYFSVRLYGGNRRSPSDQTIIDGRWHHVVWGTDGQTTYYYIDGVKQQESPPIGNVSRDVLTFGATRLNESLYQGYLDDVRVYDRGLTSEEVQKLFQITDGNTTPSTRYVTLEQGDPGLPGDGVSVVGVTSGGYLSTDVFFINETPTDAELQEGVTISLYTIPAPPEVAVTLLIDNLSSSSGGCDYLFVAPVQNPPPLDPSITTNGATGISVYFSYDYALQYLENNRGCSIPSINELMVKNIYLSDLNTTGITPRIDAVVFSAGRKGGAVLTEH